MPNFILNGHPQQHSDPFFFLKQAIEESIDSIQLICLEVKYGHYYHDNPENTGSKGVGPCFSVGDCLHVITSTDTGLELGEIAIFIKFIYKNLF